MGLNQKKYVQGQDKIVDLNRALNKKRSDEMQKQYNNQSDVNMMQDNIKTLNQKDIEFKNRYNQFHQLDQLKGNSYVQNVLSPQSRKMIDLTQWVEKNHQKKVQQTQVDHDDRQNYLKQWRKDTRSIVEGQIQQNQANKESQSMQSQIQHMEEKQKIAHI